MLTLSDILNILKIDRDLTLLRNYYNALKALCESDFFKQMHEKSNTIALSQPATYLINSIENLKREDVVLDDNAIENLSRRALCDSEHWHDLDKYSFDMVAMERAIFDQYYLLRRLFMLDDLKQDLLTAVLIAVNNSEEKSGLEDSKSAVDNKSLDNAVATAFANPDAKILRAAVSDMKSRVLDTAGLQSNSNTKKLKSAKKKKKN